MNFTITRTPLNNIMSTTIAFSGYGNGTMTPEQEQKLLTEFPVLLTYTGISFTGKYNVSANNTNSVVIDATAGDPVSLAVNNQSVPLDNKFQVMYSVDLTKIASTELGTHLNSALLVGIAKLQLFEDKIQAQLNTILTDVRTKDSAYFDQSPVTVTI